MQQSNLLSSNGSLFAMTSHLTTLSKSIRSTPQICFAKNGFLIFRPHPISKELEKEVLPRSILDKNSSILS